MPIERFLGRVALLTGATQGIGLATARRLAQEGCKVVISSRKQENVDEAIQTLNKEGLQVSGLVGNQRVREDRKKLLEYTCEKYGGIDCVFMSAGVSPHQGSLLTVNEDQFSRAFDTNVKANFQFIQDLLPVFKERGGGSIVANATAGVYGVTQLFGTGKNLFLYSISKTALVAMIQHVSRDCFNENIRVNVVAPGPVDTRFLSGGVDESNFTTYWNVAGVDKEDLAARVGRPEEIASTVAYLLSDDASYLTGNCLITAGGFVLSRCL
ncbi:dehydrogenase/reductase SDR family member 4-like isoform X2 [Apostichopus japonicus]|uniref:dehydrogenase/reductase SDR family member 4-like isoform X2 n=1 Tax=Stichopus japonicus TaxID=307972 RepID=UPI003AB21D30